MFPKNNKVPKLMTGTTTMGVVCEDGVVLATESQAIMGYLVATKDATKLFKITPRIGMTIAGGVADCQHVVKQLSALLAIRELELGKPTLVKAAAQLTAVLLFQNRMFPFYSALLMGGFDEEGTHLYSLDPFGSIIEEKQFTSVGSGSVVGFGVLEAGYKEKMTVKNGIELVKRAVDAAKKRDIASGGKMQIATITKKGLEFVN
ncbi:MAG: proteasome subunit beta [Candidatus Helarchaeota archaeon]|nr:proteasome subunit beta [Candidatus Helarchaeota archaeon]